MGIELCGFKGNNVLFRVVELYEDAVQVNGMQSISRDKLENALFMGTIKCESDWPLSVRRCFDWEVERFYEACDYIDIAAKSEDGYYEFGNKH